MAQGHMGWSDQAGTGDPFALSPGPMLTARAACFPSSFAHSVYKVAGIEAILQMKTDVRRIH